VFVALNRLLETVLAVLMPLYRYAECRVRQAYLKVLSYLVELSLGNFEARGNCDVRIGHGGVQR
jgi:hypothetical protein